MLRPREQLRCGGLAISDPVMKTASLLLQAFIRDQIGSMAEGIAELALEQVSQAPNIKRLVEVLKPMAQEMDNDNVLQRLITKKGAVRTAVDFFHVAEEIFSEGITWNLVAALFCIASKLVIKALIIDGMPEQIKPIMNWTLDFLQVRLLAWIKEQGGWDDLLSKHGATLKWMAVAMAIGSGLLALARLRRT